MGKVRTFNETAIFKNPHHEALIGVWWTGMLLRKHANRFFKKHNSSDIQFNILMQLHVESRPLNQQELSDRLFVDKSNLTGVAGRMETAGLIRRADDPKDKRAYRLHLTAAGRKALADMEEPYREEVMSIMKQFSPKEAATLTDLMRRMQLSIQETLDGKAEH